MEQLARLAHINTLVAKFHNGKFTDGQRDFVHLRTTILRECSDHVQTRPTIFVRCFDAVDTYLQQVVVKTVRNHSFMCFRCDTAKTIKLIKLLWFRVDSDRFLLGCLLCHW